MAGRLDFAQKDPSQAAQLGYNFRGVGMHLRS